MDYVDVFVSDPDHELGKVPKYRRLNPIGEDVYLMPDGSIVRDEDKIIRAQRIFKQNYWHPDGRGARRVLSKYVLCGAQGSGSDRENQQCTPRS